MFEKCTKRVRKAKQRDVAETWSTNDRQKDKQCQKSVRKTLATCHKSCRKVAEKERNVMNKGQHVQKSGGKVAKSDGQNARMYHDHGHKNIPNLPRGLDRAGLIGFNYRMTELQAALGVSQMERLEEFVSSRHMLARRYDEKLLRLPITLPFQLENTYSGLHLYVIRLHLKDIKKTHKQVFDELREKEIGVNLHYIPVHTQPYYKAMGFDWGDFPEAEKYYQEAISIPMFHGMTIEQQDIVIKALKEVLV